MIRKYILSIICALTVLSSAAQIDGIIDPREQQTAHRTQKEWADATAVSVGREQPRSFFMSYSNRDIARDNDYSKSDWYLPLNGKWNFAYYDDYRTAPVAEFFKPSFNVSKWAKINVPGNWERQGYGTPIYTNTKFEFNTSNPQPPLLPAAIPVGLYRTTFDIPLLLRDRDVFLALDGIKGASTIYINGEKVGYTEDSKSRAEFQINKYIKEGTNTLAIEVMRYGTGSYLECQDFWRISGIERDVFIWSQPRTRIDDFRVVATLDSTYTNGVFQLEIALKNTFIKPSGYMQVWFEIEDDQTNLVEYSYAEIDMPGNSVDTVRFEKILPNVKKWSAENPNLYSLVLKIKQDGRFVEYASAKIGFRTSEIKGRDYLINGKRVLLKGVNYHEHNEVTGHYVSEELIEKDMRLMKEANINAIRLAHYPQQRRFYELADKYGFYLVNEANVEAHGMYYDLRKGQTLGNNPLFFNAIMDRTVNMYEQSKNHPSVVIWSLGNEAGNGYNFYETYLYLKGIDTLRPVQYERALLEWNTDIFCPQYPSAANLSQWATEDTDRPYIPSEFAHAMGNSTGGFKDQWDAIYASKNLQGGFIWDWVDQGFLEYNADSTDVAWFYGGDYKGTKGQLMPSEGNFLCNGVVNADRTPKPALMSEIKKVHQSIRFSAEDLANGVFEIKNIYDFTSTDNFTIDWKLKANSKTIRSGVLALSLAAGASKIVTIPVGGFKIEPATEYFVEFSARLKADNGLLKKGHEVASDQFQLPISAPKTQYRPTGTLKISDMGKVIDVSSSYFSLAVDKTTGYIASYDVNGVEMIEDEFGLRPSFWRAATDNDYGSQFPRAAEPWRAPTAGLKATSVTSTTATDGSAIITAKYALPDATALTVTYKVYPSGIVHVDYNFKGNPSSKLYIARLGMRLRIPQEYTSLEYFGRGPAENYIDRKWGSNIGLYKSHVDNENFDYVRPQETGHHTDTRYLSLTSGKKGGIAVIADKTLEFNALRNSVEDFDAEGQTAKKYPYQFKRFTDNEDHSDAAAYGIRPRHTHIWDIKARPYVELSIDYRMMGVGGDDSWGARPYQKYMIHAKDDAQWGFTIVPIRSTADATKAATYSY